MKRALIFSPYYKPMCNGLSDYSQKFCNELVRNGIEVHLIISEGCSDDNNSYSCLKNWNFISLYKEKKKLQEADRVIIQYVPYMYGKRGINFQFSFFIFYLKFALGKKIDLFVHEIGFPVQMPIKHIFLGIIHWAMYILNCLASNRVFTSTDGYRKKTKKLFPFKRHIYYLPIFSNIEFNQKITFQLDSEINYIALMGQLHPAKLFDQYYPELLEYCGSNPKTKIIHIGVSLDEIKKLLPAILPDLIDQYVIATGIIDEVDASSIFQQAKVTIAYFIDGVSSRRGSALASIVNYTPIITSYPIADSEIFHNQGSIFLLSRKIEEFKSKLKQTLDIVINNEIKVSEPLRKYFDKKEIIKKYLNF